MSRPARIVNRERPEARQRQAALDVNVAAAVERRAAIVGGGDEGEAVAEPERQFAGACEGRARVRIGVDRSAFRPGRPRADLHRAEIAAARGREPGQAEAADDADGESDEDER